MNGERYSDIAIETLNRMWMACYRMVSPTPEEDGSKYIDEWVAKQNVKGSVRKFGFDTEVTQDQHRVGLRGYEVWRTIPLDVQPSEGVTIREFEGGLYAVMTIYKPFSDPFTWIPAGWKELHEWVINSDSYRGANHQWLEELITRENVDDLKLYHPITVSTG